ncbi:MAG: 50S ribosomal L9 C-terminal domain-containing protein, partial [Raoultibacter sp.]
RIDLKSPIKTAGEHEVVISLYRDIKTKLSLFVGGENQEIPAEEAAAAVEAAEDAEAREELKNIEEAIIEEAATSVQAADAAGDAQAAAEAAETLDEVVEAEKEL